MNRSDVSDQLCNELPKAKVSKDWKTYLFWLVPLGAALMAAYFIYDNTDKGPTIHIYFADATGLQEGKSTVKYRGGTVGQVEDLELTPDHKLMDVTVSLKKQASGLARQGSQFWIVRAEVGATQIRGLGTVVSGDYITVEPGDGKPETQFQGLAQGPVITPPGTLFIVLLTERVESVQPRAPVFYRGLQVGEISKCDLGPQAQTIQVTAEIQKPYAPLVRMNSVFWKAGGINLNIGLDGANLSAQSFKTLISGGVDFATPDTTLKPAPPGTFFRLYAKPKEEWLAWSPAINLNGATSPPATMPSVGGGL